ncbi:unnamed protein product, partial [Ectocarpus sp. 12 AP-2014]
MPVVRPGFAGGGRSSPPSRSAAPPPPGCPAIRWRTAACLSTPLLSSYDARRGGLLYPPGAATVDRSARLSRGSDIYLTPTFGAAVGIGPGCSIPMERGLVMLLSSCRGEGDRTSPPLPPPLPPMRWTTFGLDDRGDDAIVGIFRTRSTQSLGAAAALLPSSTERCTALEEEEEERAPAGAAPPPLHLGSEADGSLPLVPP